MATIAERIKEALELRGMKQSELVEKTGIGKSSISTYISGEYEPKQRNIYKIAKALDVNESWLMGFDVSMDREKISSGTIKINMKDINIDKITSAIIKAMKEGDGSKELNDLADTITSRISDEILNKGILDDINPKLELIKDKSEILLIKNYRKLNFKGQHEASKRVEELTIINKYTKNIFKHNTQLATEADIYRQKVILQEEANKESYKLQESEALKKLKKIYDVDEIESSKKEKEHLILKAAHEIEGASEEDKQHDYDLMDDDNF